MHQVSKTLRHEVRPKGSLGGVSGAAVGRSGGGGTPRKIHFLPIFSPSAALSRLGWAGVKLRRQGLAGGGRGSLGGLSPQFAVWRYCGQGWAVRRSAVRRRCPFRRPPSAAAVCRSIRRSVPPSAAAVRCPPPCAAVCCRPPPSAVCCRGGCWGAVPLAGLGGAHPLAVPAGGCPSAPVAHPPKRLQAGGRGARGGDGDEGRLREADEASGQTPAAPPAWGGWHGGGAAKPRRSRDDRPRQGGRQASRPLEEEAQRPAPKVPAPECAPLPPACSGFGVRVNGRRGAAASRHGEGVRSY